jgi:hypothetical protein
MEDREDRLSSITAYLMRRQLGGQAILCPISQGANHSAHQDLQSPLVSEAPYLLLAFLQNRRLVAYEHRCRAPMLHRWLKKNLNIICIEYNHVICLL